MKSGVLIVCCAVVLLMSFLSNAEMSDALSQSYSREGTDRSIERAIEYLRSQQHGDGSICDTDKNKTAMTALAIMAMSAVGHQVTDDTPEGRAMTSALNYVLDRRRVDENGYFGSHDGSRMYGHGIVTVMLAEMLGMCTEEQNELILKRLQEAVDVILKAQKKEHRNYLREHGGWRYHPQPKLNIFSDISVTIWQVMALRAARNAGLDVPVSSIKDAIGYIKRIHRNPSFRYSTVYSQPPTFNAASMGIMALYLLGEGELPQVKQSLNWLKGKREAFGEGHWFYGIYYHSQAMYQVGGERAAEAREWIEKVLLSKQNNDGSWLAPDSKSAHNEREAGRVYCTSMATLTLAVHHHFLPIYQR